MGGTAGVRNFCCIGLWIVGVSLDRFLRTFITDTTQIGGTNEETNRRTRCMHSEFDAREKFMQFEGFSKRKKLNFDAL